MLKRERPYISDQEGTSEEGETDDDINESEHEETLKVMRKLLSKAKQVTSKQGRKRKNNDEHSTSKKQVKSAPTRRKPSREVKRWENSEVSKLIEMLEERTRLWDVFHPNYHMREKREKALKEIEDELGASPSDVKAKIMSLRAQLGREIAKVAKTKSGQSTNELHKPNWVFWEQLQFLRPVMQPGKSRDNLKSSSLQSHSEAAEGINEFEEISFGTVKEKSTPKESKENKKTMECKKQELLEACINVLKEPIARPNQQCHFTQYVSEKLQKFDGRTRVIAEKRITNILFDLEINGVSDQILSTNVNLINNEYNHSYSEDNNNNGQFSYMVMLQQ